MPAHRLGAPPVVPVKFETSARVSQRARAPCLKSINEDRESVALRTIDRSRYITCRRATANASGFASVMTPTGGERNSRLRPTSVETTGSEEAIASNSTVGSPSYDEHIARALATAMTSRSWSCAIVGIHRSHCLDLRQSWSCGAPGPSPTTSPVNRSPEAARMSHASTKSGRFFSGDSRPINSRIGTSAGTPGGRG